MKGMVFFFVEAVTGAGPFVPLGKDLLSSLQIVADYCNVICLQCVTADAMELAFT